ncbi:uncharacterized protein A1O5_10985 [Cladophialophora psammophila CBS 110553]|uniref:Uncharacterized protein n=1 Tax=Cladophialophora psammophila CBS 110553 TaxID=1182543 RepID=W9WDK2_9EURO|nr:uncharacterized protein A1O5_10985 [Cladophialophora psammophila CBS 110553]EXJ66008.1 hypothetical protein A1O5_10985 [Cladophialophora psammophila CBS 110553]
MKRAVLELLSVRHDVELCYEASAVLEVVSILVIQETSNIVKKTLELMEEGNFSFYVPSANFEDSSTCSTLQEAQERKEDGRQGDRAD